MLTGSPLIFQNMISIYTNCVCSHNDDHLNIFVCNYSDNEFQELCRRWIKQNPLASAIHWQTFFRWCTNIDESNRCWLAIGKGYEFDFQSGGFVTYIDLDHPSQQRRYSIQNIGLTIEEFEKIEAERLVQEKRKKEEEDRRKKEQSEKDKVRAREQRREQYLRLKQEFEPS